MAGVQGAYTACLVNASTPTNAQVVAAPSSGKLVVQWITISNGAAAGELKLLDGSGGTTKFATFLAINSPVSIDCSRAPIVLTAETGLFCTGVTSSTSRINVGYTVET